MVSSRKDAGGEPDRRNRSLAAKALQPHHLGDHIFGRRRRIVERQQIATSVKPISFQADDAVKQPSVSMFTKHQIARQKIACRASDKRNHIVGEQRWKHAGAIHLQPGTAPAQQHFLQQVFAGIYEFLRLKRHCDWVALIFPQAKARVSKTLSKRKAGF